MCLGSPKAPEVKYQGPSDEDIRRNEESLATYKQQIADQQSTFQQQLQSQIDAANAQTEALRMEYEDDLQDAQKESAAALAEANAGSLAEQVGAYQVTATQSEAAQAQTTAAIDKKKKPKKNLKISTAGAASGVGSGLNIGV